MLAVTGNRFIIQRNHRNKSKVKLLELYLNSWSI